MWQGDGGVPHDTARTTDGICLSLLGVFVVAGMIRNDTNNMDDGWIPLSLLTTLSQ